jgi:hypothetical protein
MSIPGFGDAITLFDTSIRVITFINDLRHGKMICWASPQKLMHCAAASMQSPLTAVTRTLYTCISKDQWRDLKTIVRTCDQNLKELSVSIASVAVLVEKKGQSSGVLHATRHLMSERLTGKTQDAMSLKLPPLEATRDLRAQNDGVRARREAALLWRSKLTRMSWRLGGRGANGIG